MPNESFRYSSELRFIEDIDTTYVYYDYDSYYYYLLLLSCESTDLCFGKTKLGRQLNSLGRRQIALYFEPFLQPRQLLVTEHRSRLSPSAVLPGAVLEDTGEREAYTGKRTSVEY